MKGYMMNQELLETCESLMSLFVHIEGDTKGNKIKTKILADCPDITKKLNAARNVIEKAKGKI